MSPLTNVDGRARIGAHEFLSLNLAAARFDHHLNHITLHTLFGPMIQST